MSPDGKMAGGTPATGSGGYARTWKTYVTLLEELLSPAGQEKVLYKNAKHFYNLWFKEGIHVNHI